MKWWLVLLAVLGFGCGVTTEYDLVLRNEKLISLQEAIRKLAALPAENLRLDRRGMLKAG